MMEPAELGLRVPGHSSDTTRKIGMAKSEQNAKSDKIVPRGPVWQGPTYSRVQPGKYMATVTRIQGPGWVRQYRRWSLLIEFELLGESEDVRLCAFFNLGEDPAGTRIGRHSRYFKAWTVANGDLPRKGQEMTPDVFMEGQVYTIEVTDNGKDSDGKPKTEGEVYSTVKTILSAERRPNPSITSQSIRNQESVHHPIRQSTNQGGHGIRW